MNQFKGEIIDPPSSSEENPCNSSSAITQVFEIDLLLGHILDFVPNNQLLSYRLVNHKWNSIILAKLHSNTKTKQNSEGWIIPITSKNIQDYIEFIKSTTEQKQQLASSTSTSSTTTTLAPTPTVIKPTAPLCVTIHKYYDDESTYDTILNGLHELIKLFNSGNFVSSFSIYSGENSLGLKRTINWIKVFELISLLAPGLQSLVIDEEEWKKSITSINLPDSVTSFPKLCYLKYTAIAKNPTLLAQLVNAAPKLSSLALYIPPVKLQSDSSYTRCNQMVSNAYSAINSSSCSQLKELTLILIEDTSFSSISHWKLPKLLKLTLGLRKNLSSSSGRILSRFLTQTCPVLSSLQFEYMYNPLGVSNFPNGPEQSEFPSGLPPLPKLTHFGYSDVHRSWDRYANFIRMDHLPDPQTMFPSLNSVSIEFGTYLYWSRAFAEFNVLQQGNNTQPIWYNNPSLIRHLTFDGVSSLNLTLRKNINLEAFAHGRLPKISLAEAANQYKLLFPNTTSLKIDNQVIPKDLELANFKNVYKGILLELLGGSGNSQVQCLELTNYFEDWLIELLMDETIEFGVKLQNLQTLIIPSIERYLAEAISSRGASIGSPWKERNEGLLPLANIEVRVNGVVVPIPIPTDANGNIVFGNNNNAADGVDIAPPNPLLPQQQQQQQPVQNPPLVGGPHIVINIGGGGGNNQQVEGAVAPPIIPNDTLQGIQALRQPVTIPRIIESIQPSLDLNVLLPHLRSINTIRLGKEFLVGQGANNHEENEDNGTELVLASSELVEHGSRRRNVGTVVGFKM